MRWSIDGLTISIIVENNSAPLFKNNLSFLCSNVVAINEIINEILKVESDFALEVWVSIVFSQTVGPIELKFHVKTPYAKLIKIFTKYFGHMTKMTSMPIYDKNPLKIFFSRTRRPVTLGLGM